MAPLVASPSPSPPSTATAPLHRRVAFPRLPTSVACLAFSSLLSLVAVYFSYNSLQPVYPPGSLAPDARGGGAGSCRMSFMSPSYLHLKGFGREYTRLGAGPWGLYLYREVGWDDDPFDGAQQAAPASGAADDAAHLKLTGTPVIFVPGNAGSFRQVRSLASAASRAWFEVPGVRRKGVGTREGGRSLDFFTLDYNDDFSAFHGQTLLDQSEYLADSIRYILSLYHQKEELGRPDPTSVIVVAHSMGGVVARAALLHPNYQSFSISTLITIATPHIVPPVTVDRGVDAVYDSINSFWRDAYYLSPSPSSSSSSSPSSALRFSRARAELAELVLISISGGVSDVTIASESASLASILPLNDSHGFTVFTTAIPGVQTPIDHLAILWCQQLMSVVAQSLLSIVDVRNSQGVIPRLERISTLGERLLGALESRPKKVEGRKVELETLERGEPSRRLDVGERLVIREAGRQDRTTYLLPIPRTLTYGSAARVFSLLTSSTIGRAKESIVEVYACAFSPSSTDITSACTPLFPSHVTPIPLSSHAPVSPILPAPVEDGTMGFLSVDVAQLEGMDAIAVVVKPGGGSNWVLAEFGDKEKRVQVVEKSTLQLMLGGFKLEAFPSTPNLVSEVWIPALDTSLLTFKLNVFRSECQDAPNGALFAPLVRQYSPLLHESKYYPNVRQASLYTHSSGPYLPSPASPFASSGSRLQFFLDPTCSRDGTGAPADLAVEIKVDLWATLGGLVMRYRMAAVSFPFAIVMLVLARQLKEYNAGAAFMPFGAALSLFSRQTLLPLLGLLTLLSIIQSILLGTHLSSTSAALSSASQHDLSGGAHTSLPPSWIADMLLGNQSSFFAGTAAFVLFAMVAAVVVEYLVLQALVAGMAGGVRWAHAKGPLWVKSMMPLTEPRETLPTQRVVTMGALLLLVLFFAPFQFAFLVIFLVHFFSTVRALLLAQDISSPTTPASTKRLWDRYHYSFAILLAMMGLLPINALILVVWVRNLAVGWLAPFSTDHNVLNVVGFLLNVEALHSGKMLHRTPGSIPSTVSLLLPSLAAAFSLLYGIRYAHHIYPLANAFFLWLAANNSQALVGAVHEAVIGKRRSSLVPAQRDVPGLTVGVRGVAGLTKGGTATSPGSATKRTVI